MIITIKMVKTIKTVKTIKAIKTMSVSDLTLKNITESFIDRVHLVIEFIIHKHFSKWT